VPTIELRGLKCGLPGCQTRPFISLDPAPSTEQHLRTLASRAGWQTAASNLRGRPRAAGLDVCPTCRLTRDVGGVMAHWVIVHAGGLCELECPANCPKCSPVAVALDILPLEMVAANPGRYPCAIGDDAIFVFGPPPAPPTVYRPDTVGTTPGGQWSWPRN